MHIAPWKPCGFLLSAGAIEGSSCTLLPYCPRRCSGVGAASCRHCTRASADTRPRWPLQGCADPVGFVQGSATLSMAYAGALFADACLRGLNGEPNVEEFTFVQSTVVPGLPFFSSKVKLGPTGARPSHLAGFFQNDSSVPDMECPMEVHVAVVPSLAVQSMLP